MKSTYILSTFLLAGFAAVCQAQTTASYQAGAYGSFNGDIAVNLIQAGQSSLASSTADTSALNGVFSAVGLNDGSAAGNINATYYEVVPGNGTSMPNTATFQLSAGYDISSVEVISGWGDHNLGAQNFQLLLSINNGPFGNFGTYNNSGGAASSSYLTTLTGSSGPIATDVTGVEFIFTNPDTSNGAGNVGNSQAGGGSDGGTVIDELQVFGTLSTVPEPATTSLLCAGLLGIAGSIRRKQARR